MRTILAGDLIAAARVLLAVLPTEQRFLAEKMIDQAHMAHVIFKRLGRAHPTWGNGSLMARANAMTQRREPYASDPGYLNAIRVVIEALLARYAARIAKR